jgi:hypothetical protein
MMDKYIISPEGMTHIIMCIIYDERGEYPSDDEVTGILRDVAREILIESPLDVPDPNID